MRRLSAVRRALLAALAALGAAAPAGAGEIRGQVRLTGPVPPPALLRVTIDHYVCGTEKRAEDLVVSPARELQNVVVWLGNPPPGAPSAAPGATAQMDQQGCVFTPRVVVVPAGGTVEFLNSDRLLHNLHGTPRDNPAFNRTQPRGRTIPITFARPEIVQIACDLHAWMRAWVVVAAHAFYAVTDGQGRFRLDNLPPGPYTLHYWHERLGTGSRPVTVGEAPTAVTIELAVP
jgi:plastocyanin